MDDFNQIFSRDEQQREQQRGGQQLGRGGWQLRLEHGEQLRQLEHGGQLQLRHEHEMVRDVPRQGHHGRRVR